MKRHQDYWRRPFLRKRCRAVGCRQKTYEVHTLVTEPGVVVWAHLCERHYRQMRESGDMPLKPVKAPA